MSDAPGSVEASPASDSIWDWSAGSNRGVNATSQVVTAAPLARLPADPGSAVPGWAAAPTTGRSGTGTKASHISLLVAGALTIVGSVTTWVSVTLFGHTISIGGTDPGISNALTISGWFTVALGIVMVVLAALLMVSSKATLRALAVTTSGLTLGFSTYYVVRVVQELSKAHAAAARFSAFGRSLPVSEHIGWGLVLLLIAAVSAVISSGIALRTS
jgi:hypothetical protein